MTQALCQMSGATILLLATVSPAIAGPDEIEMAVPEAAFPEVVSQEDIARTYRSWHIQSLRSGGSSLVTSDQPDAPGRRGSLEQVLPAPGSSEWSTALEIFSEDAILLPGEGIRAFGGGFGRLNDLLEASYLWYRKAGGTSSAWLATAFRLVVYDPDEGLFGSTYSLVFEPVYNGFPPPAGVPANQWIRSDARQGFTWREPIYLDGVRVPRNYCASFPDMCFDFNRGPLEWGFGADTIVIGVQLAAGSGWSGSFQGFADDVNLRFSAGDSYHWNFEPPR